MDLSCWEADGMRFKNHYSLTISKLDEIHRLNKDKQDILLPQLESGLITDAKSKDSSNLVRQLYRHLLIKPYGAYFIYFGLLAHP